MELQKLKEILDIPSAEDTPGAYLLFTDDDLVETVMLDISKIIRIEKGPSEKWGDGDEDAIRVFYPGAEVRGKVTKEDLYRPMGSTYLFIIPKPCVDI